jgi:bla regulator protein BlaR1
MILAELQAVISSIGWSLIHFLWQGTLITLVYWIVTRSIQSIHAKYWTGMALVVISLVVPLTNSIQLSTQQNLQEAVLMAQPVVAGFQTFSTEQVLLYLIESSLPYFVLMWVLTVMFLSFRLIKSWIRLAAIKHECQPEDSRKLKQLVKNIAIKLDLPTIPMLKVSQAVLVPAAYGLLKPTVLLPLSLISQIPQNQLEAIIKHELCHLKRNDFVHNIIQLCADILLFFHPGIRWMNNDIRHIREQCCDQMVLSNDTEALTYAKALTNIASYTSGLELKHSVHLGINDGMLLNRVKILLHNKSNQSSLMIFAPLLMMIVFVFMMLQPASEQSDSYSDLNARMSQTQNLLPENTDNESSYGVLFGRNDFYPTLDAGPVNAQVSTAYPAAENDLTSGLELTAISHSTIEELSASISIDETLNQTSRQELIASDPAPEATTAKLDLISEMPVAAVNDMTFNVANEASAEEPVNPESPTQVLRSFDQQNSIMPKFKRYQDPVYPQHFWFNQIEQDVIASFRIRPNGKAYDIKVSSQKNDFIAFEQEVVKAIKKWKFEPESLNHSTLQRTYQQIFSFAISEEVQKNCDIVFTGSRVKRAMPCNK